MMKRIAILALATVPLLAFAQEPPPAGQAPAAGQADTQNSAPSAPAPAPELPPMEPVYDSPPPDPVYEQPPPAGEPYSGAGDGGDANPYQRAPGRSGQLGEQERELLDLHRQNADRAKSRKASRRTSVPAAKSASAGPGASSPEAMLNVDYVDEPIVDVLRAIATAFKLSIIPDKDLGDVKVTIHLENLPVLEGLEKLCKSHGLEMIADGRVYRVRKARENAFSVIEVRNKRMNLDVQNRPVKDFLREFVEKTKINIVPGQDLKGTVTGHLKDVQPIDGFKALMAANDYSVRLKNGVYLVENGDSAAPEMAVRRGRRPGGYPGGAGNSDVDVHEGMVTLTLSNASLGDAIREIAEQAGHNYTIIGDVSGNVNAQLKNVTVDEALSALLQGTRYAFINRKGTLLIGDRNPNTPSGQALSGAELVYLKYIKAENIEKTLPKSIPAENIKVIKEQNAVLISGTVDDINLVKNFLLKVDAPTPQVLLEVVVVEYNRGKDSELGIGTGQTGYAGVNGLITGSMSGIRQEISNGSFRGSIGILPPKFELNLRALESKNKAKILSMPKVTTLNGNKAELKVNRTSYYKVSSVTKDGFQNNDFRTIDDGISIEMTPWVTRHGEVNVNISPSIKTAGQGQGDSPPPITNRSITTNVTLMDGETIALGGLINSKEDNIREFVPILGSIPVLGYLFSWRKALTFTTELVIYVTPHILNPETQAVNLEDEFRSLDRRSGFLRNSDFIRNGKPGPRNDSPPADLPPPPSDTRVPEKASKAAPDSLESSPLKTAPAGRDSLKTK